LVLKAETRDQGAASFCNYAGHMRYKHPWGAKSDAPAILLLPSFEGGFFDPNGVAHLRDAMCQVTVQTLAMGGEPALDGGMLSSGCLVPLALVPVQARGAVFFDAPLLVVVLRVIGTALPLHLALKAPFFPGSGSQLLTKRDQLRSLALAGDNRQRRGPDVQADGVGFPLPVLWFDERMAL
jgi:hypothetical protein